MGLYFLVFFSRDFYAFIFPCLCLFVFPFWSLSGVQEPEIKELQRSITAYDIWYFPQHFLLCTYVHDQSANICIQGYFRIRWIRNTKSSKKDWIHKCYVSCFKLGYFFKSCKTECELYATSVREMAL